MKTLLVIPSFTKPGLQASVESDEHPTMDYDALAAHLRSCPGNHVELIDYNSVEREQDATVCRVRKLAGPNAALALMAFQRRDEFDAVFTNAENVALPLALLFKTVSKRPRHVTIAHRLSARKKQMFYRWMQVHSEMDAIFVYASIQRDFALETLKVPASKLRLINFHADHRFYRPFTAVPTRDDQICAAGLEWRDYPTLIDAVADQTHLKVRLAAASPWSKDVNETERRTLPAHVEARRYNYRELRELYAGSSFVVVPLYQNDFQAGITTILEAMAMGKPVIATRTRGQTDVLVEGKTGLYVPEGDVKAWRRAIQRLSRDSALRAELGAKARTWVEQNATLDKWVEHVSAALHGEPALVSPGGRSEGEATTPFRRISVVPGAPVSTHPASEVNRNGQLLSG